MIYLKLKEYKIIDYHNIMDSSSVKLKKKSHLCNQNIFGCLVKNDPNGSC